MRPYMRWNIHCVIGQCKQEVCSPIKQNYVHCTLTHSVPVILMYICITDKCVRSMQVVIGTWWSDLGTHRYLMCNELD